MTRVLLTGGSGFVGRHVRNALKARNVDFVAPFRDGYRLGHPFDKDSGFGFGETDFDIVIHLVWSGLPNYHSPGHLDQVPQHILFLRQFPHARIVVTGTCQEYGARDGQLTEDMSPSPNTSYGFAKDVLRRSAACTNARWLRLFYLYGEGQAPTSLYSQYRAAQQRADGKAFPMSGGEQLRDFMPVERAAEAIVDVALADEAPPIVNVCSGEPTRVLDLVRSWGDLPLNLGAYPYPDYEPMAFWGDASRLHALQARERAAACPQPSLSPTVP